MILNRRSTGALAALLGTLAVVAAPRESAAGDWPSWRGPSENGITEESVPVRFGADENLAWRVPLPGPAGSTPVIAKERIYLSSADGDDLVLLAVSLEGKELWRRRLGSGNTAVRGDEGNYASPSPVTDGDRVWAFVANGPLACFDRDGKELWRVDLQDRYGKFEIQFGLSSTPILDRGRIYAQLIHGKWNKTPSQGWIVCLNAATGEEIWKHERRTDAIDECKQSYASPILHRDDRRSYLVAHGADWTTAHDLETGNVIWRLGGLNPATNYNNTLRFVASPVSNEGLIVIPTAKNGRVVAVEPGATGDITGNETSIRWVLPRSTPDVPSPLIRDGIVYLCRENGVLIALDAKTGKTLYEERTVSDRHRASPVWADGKIYLTARKGVVSVVQAGREFKLLASNDLGEAMSASPAIADGVLYLRTFEALWAIREKK